MFRAGAVALAVVGLVAGQLVAAPTPAAQAISASEFNPGFIISDSQFYNGNAMSQAQIQEFLNAKCPTNNCLNVVSAESNTRAATNMCPNGYTGASSESAA